MIAPTIVDAIGAATGHWPFRPHLLGDTGYFRLVGGDLHDGLDRWVRTLLPYDPVKAAQLHAVVVLAIFACFAALAAALLVWRSPYPAIVVGFIPFLVVSTVYVLPRPTLRAAIFLALMLAVLGVLSQRRRPTIQLAAGATVVLVAMLAATLPGVAKSAMLDWKQWGKPEKTGTSVGFIWNHSYAGLKRPKRPVTLLRVTADSPVVLACGRALELQRRGVGGRADRGRHLRAAQRRRAAGRAVGDRAGPVAEAEDGQVPERQPGHHQPRGAVRGARDQGRRRSTPVSSAARPTACSRPTRTCPSTPPGRPSTCPCSRRSRTSPSRRRLSRPTCNRRRLSLLDESVEFPVWGAPGREAAVDDLLSQHFFDPQLVRWREVYDQARELTKDARSPYEAVAAIESYFQSNYRYDEKADYSQATDGPLPSFFLDGKRGYCQMYAGTMTVILRMLGIPSRIGEGFTEGTRNVSRGTYVVTDRDAHAWVEVWFPKYGWMAFEPTPSRELPFNYSTTSKDFSEAAQSALAGVAGFDSARLEQLARLAGTPSRVAGATLGGARAQREGGGGVGAVVGKDWHPGFVSWLLLLAAGVVLLLVLAKRVRSVIPYLRKGPHAIAGAVRRDLEAFVRDQGVPDAVVTLTPEEFARMLRREFGVDAAGWARMQSRARYGPSDARADAAARGSRREARTVKRSLRKSLGRTERARGAVRLRSLLP